jgi:hypothetical protein
METKIFDINNDKPTTAFQHKVLEFIDEFGYTSLYVDEDGELIFGNDSEKFCVREYKDESDLKCKWKKLQKSFDSGER